MKEDLNHRKIAIVTGGSAGLGFAIAKKFVSHNITTVITGRNTQKLEEAKLLHENNEDDVQSHDSENFE